MTWSCCLWPVRRLSRLYTGLLHYPVNPIAYVQPWIFRKGGLNHFSSLFMKLYLVNGVNIPSQHLKISLLVISWGLWLLNSGLQKWYLHLSCFDVKGWHQPTLVGWCMFEVLGICVYLRFLIPHLYFFVHIFDVLFSVSWPDKGRHLHTLLSL